MRVFTKPSKKFYVYAYYEENASCPFYVGKGTKDRAWDGLRPSERRSQPFLQNKLSKIGQQGIEVEVDILFESDNEPEVYAMEQFYVAAYGRRSNGTGCLVNITAGGAGCLGEIVAESVREAQRRKNRNSGHMLLVVCPKTGVILSEFALASDAAKALGISEKGLRDALRKPYQRHHGHLFWYADSGRTFEGYKKKVENSARIRRQACRKYNSIGVQQLDPLSGDVIAEFASATEAAAEITEGKSQSSAIVEVCKGRLATAFGFGWQYTAPERRCPPMVCKVTTRSIEQVDSTTGKTIAVFQTIREAATAVGGSPASITNVARGRNKTHKGFRWRYADSQTPSVGA